MMFFDSDLEQQESQLYRPGQKVELKQQPGVIDWIESYDPMMVPPITLVSDPKPRYPEELRVLRQPVVQVEWFVPQTPRANRYPACALRDRPKAPGNRSQSRAIPQLSA